MDYIESVPAEQSLQLIRKMFRSTSRKIKMNSCFSLMIGMNEKLNLNYDAAFIENKDIAWYLIIQKPCRRRNQSLLIKKTYEYASRNINSPNDQIMLSIY